MSSSAVRHSPEGATFVLLLCVLLFLARPDVSRGDLPTASVTVCQVSGSASAPSFAQVAVSGDRLAAYLNQNAGSFVGSCPSSDGTSGTSGLSGAVTVCRVSGTASAPVLSQVVVGVDNLAAYLNQNPGSFVGSCPAASGGNAGTPAGGAGPASAIVTVCRVTSSARAPGLAQLTIAVDEVAAFVNQNPGSFVGTCPGKGGTMTKGPGRILGIPAGAALTICQVSASGSALRYVQTNVAIDRFAAFVNQHPASFVGLCPSPQDPNGTIGNEPLGYVTLCRVTGAAKAPLAAVTVRADQRAAYLTRAGTVLTPAATGCTPRGDDPGTEPPSTIPTDKPTEIVVYTTPNTVVTARGAGVDQAARSDERGRARLKLKPTKPGLVTVRAAKGKVTRTLGVAAHRRSGGNLTG
jgi:hypothetical protein